jgi:hypothetical protein
LVLIGQHSSAADAVQPKSTDSYVEWRVPRQLANICVIERYLEESLWNRWNRSSRTRARAITISVTKLASHHHTGVDYCKDINEVMN